MTSPGTTTPAAAASAAESLKALDARARAVYETVRDAVIAHGYPPSMREIGAAVGLTSPSSVKHQLDKLERFGLVRRDPNRPRALEVVLPDRPGPGADPKDEEAVPAHPQERGAPPRRPSCRAWPRARPSRSPSSDGSPQGLPFWPSRASRTLWRCPGV